MRARWGARISLFVSTVQPLVVQSYLREFGGGGGSGGSFSEGGLDFLKLPWTGPKPTSKKFPS